MPDTNTIASMNGGDLLASRSQSKKRRIPGACDICKRKKIRCDSGDMPDNRCSNCTQFGLECTHKEVTKTLGPAKGYVESLEARLEKMDRLLSKLLPGIDVIQEVDRIEAGEDNEAETLPRNDDDQSNTMLAIQLSRLTINPPQNRFFGKSSSYHLVQTALNLKQEYTGDPPKTSIPYIPLKRLEFWDIPPWMSSNPEEAPSPNYIYPDDDLLPSLIDAYFEQINHFLPLLHRPTFEKSVTRGLHFSDPMFGATLLLVCAHGSRYSFDPRVLSEGSDSPRSAGWKWFEQVNVLRKSLFKRTTLYELQMLALHVLFAQSSETPQGIWAEIGLAVRLSQEVGAHRKRQNKDAFPTAEDELWKRAFWVVLSLDRHISSFSGRACGLQDEDFDLDLPLECDDEYWEQGFRQPPEKPSSIAFFNSYLRLTDILAYAMRLIYSIKRSTHALGKAAPRSEQQLIAELDSAMNNWMDSVPSHLRWNPNCDNELFLKQSAALHATYYHLQIFIHRPFIPSPRNPIPSAFPSLAICTNAARSCCHVLESFTRVSALPLAQLQVTAFTAAVILLLNIWSGKRSGYAPNPRREMEDVQRCMQVLQASEKRWAAAGRYWDILIELAFAGDVSILNHERPPSTASSGKKRPRDADVDGDDSPTNHARSVPGRRRVSSNNNSSDISPQIQPALNFSLPMYSNELGRLPIYGQFNFSDSIGASSRHYGGTGIPCMQTTTTTPAASAAASANLDQYILSSLASSGGAVGAIPPNLMDAYVVDALFNGQTVESLMNLNGNPNYPIHLHDNLTNDHINDIQNDGAPSASMSAEDLAFASLFAGAGASFDLESDLSRFGTMPAMDNDTMTMWSTAPTGLELEDWNLYISSVEQMTQAQGHTTT